MDDVASGPIPQFLSRLTEILQHAPVNKLEFTRRGHRTDQSGNAVDDQTKFAFCCPQRLLSALPVVNVRKQEIPANDAPLCVSWREPAHIKPAIHAVSAPHAVLDALRPPGL